MDRIIKSYLGEFSKSHGIDSNTPSRIFEDFVNFTIIDPKTEYSYDVDDLNIGDEGNIGIDGFALLLNKQVINNADELNDFLDEHKKSEAEIIFIQSKTSKKFNTKDINHFGATVKDFISEIQKLNWSDSAREKIILFNTLIERVSELKNNPQCLLFYVSLGKNKNDQNILATTESAEENIKAENLFSSVELNLIDSTLLVSKYKKIGQSIEKSFEFPNKVTLPEINNIKEAYIGVINTKSVIDLMTGDNEEMLDVFYDNVRDYQGTNKVNREIIETLESNHKDSFSILNNGITIVAENVIITRNTFTISNYQIINGCQTSHVLFSQKDKLDETVQVPIKLIISNNNDLTAKVIRSTNRQTEIKEQDLLAFSAFQKSLEDFYQTFIGAEKLYYERRSKQYRNKDIERKRIIDKTVQIKAIASLYYDQPNLATRFFGAVFSKLQDRLFQDDDYLLPYFTAAFAIYKIEELFKTKKIDKKYKKIKYHILTMFRYEVTNKKCPLFNSKEVEKYCTNILNILRDEDKTTAYILAVLTKIDSLEPDLTSLELSKSKNFLDDCLAQYNK